MLIRLDIGLDRQYACMTEERSVTTLTRRTVLLLLLCFLAVSLQAYTLRVGSAAPENSPWGRALNRAAAEWERISDGRVRVQVFHNSIAGTEADMVRKMRIGQLQAVVITSTGLSNFSDRSLTLSMPLLIRNQGEYEYVFDRVRDELEADILDEGFHVMSWSMAGWMYFFSDEEIRTPDELKAVKMAASPEEMELVRAYQLMGYQPIPLPYTERLAGLTNGMANAYLTVPILAAGFQWFGVTPYMMDLKVGPAPGAVLMSDRAYRQLPADLRDDLFEALERVTAELDQDIRELESESIDTMVRFGLNIVELTDAEEAVWVEELEASYESTIGLVFNEEFYEQIRELLDEYRSSR
jgi:TRAP-type C4-dicarboxylate transport system substrate-binding protein